MAIQTRQYEGFDGIKKFDGFDTFAIEEHDDAVNELRVLRHAFEERIAHWLTEAGREDLLTSAMRAGALGSGKRMRPLLLMLVARDLGCSSPALIDVACAVEMVHAASLVLDDMPCMDNAQLRRGQPTIHVQFGEDVAILSSIALLSRAFGILAAAQDIPATVRNRLVAKLAETIGTQGLVKGQFLDLHGGRATVDDIATTNELKTGVLLGVAVDMAAIIAQADDEVAASLRAFALAAGHAFQIRDDFQDTPGNDSAVTGKDTGKDIGKATLINTVGRDEARRQLAAHLAEADRCLDAALGQRRRTRRFIEGLFGGGADGRAFGSPLRVHN
ncbi:polyprenyl synthetase family protein [Massilia forsythiae]|uniref:Polyprenyl synthetase family protein n=1 Tax=Massilia forsythiae TaxID=2728020 RepID=A0A7Z2VUH1_9BURK|nr:polyprenyl synthetase family protein [Massilia forsythiae]QJD99357.1 polyprenyl synthetase family protein [Massilia forsythiae]